MTETTTGPDAAVANPLDPDAFVHGGGLWDGKVVTITSAVAKTEALKYADGSPVIDKETKQQSIQTALYLKGIADGPDDKERHEEYSAGDKVKPLPDGSGFVDKETGGPPKFHANSNIAKLAAALKTSGFDLSLLWDVAARKQNFAKLVGARFTMKASPKLGRDGKALTDKKGYAKNIHLPVKFVGFATGVAATAAAGGAGNGAAAPNAIGTKAESAVIAALANGPLKRADLVRTLAGQLAGDPDANAVIALVVRDDFHTGKPWKYDGTQASL